VKLFISNNTAEHSHWFYLQICGGATATFLLPSIKDIKHIF